MPVVDDIKDEAAPTEEVKEAAPTEAKEAAPAEEKPAEKEKS